MVRTHLKGNFMFYIYCITNQITGEKYVGQTVQPVEARFRSHLSMFRNKDKHPEYQHRPLMVAMEAYGVENFILSVLEEVSNESLLDDREIFWIKTLDTFNNGYNSTRGGSGFNHYDRELISRLISMGYTREQICQTFGCSLATVTDVIKTFNLGAPRRSNSRIVGRFDLITGELLQKYTSMRNASKWVLDSGKTRSSSSLHSISGNIRDVCNECENCFSSYGYGWKYLPDPLFPIPKELFREPNKIDLSEAELNKAEELIRLGYTERDLLKFFNGNLDLEKFRKNGLRIRSNDTPLIEQIDPKTGKQLNVFWGIPEAAQYILDNEISKTKINYISRGILDVCRGAKPNGLKRNYAYGYKWKFLNLPAISPIEE